MREGFLVPTLDEVKKHAATLGISDETATDFWYLFDGQGWRTKGGAFIYNWRSLLTSFNHGRKRLEMGDAKRTAHIDAKMDEHEEALPNAPEKNFTFFKVPYPCGCGRCSEPIFRHGKTYGKRKKVA